MPLKVSKSQIMRAKDRAFSLARRASAYRQKADQAVETLVGTAEVGASSFALGLIQGRYGGVEIVGVPLDLTAAIAFHGLAFVGVGGKLSGHLHSFGDGALATYLATLGRGAGVEMRRKALGAGASIQGEEGRRFTDKELIDLAT